MKTLNIFKPGTHTSNEGAVIDFAEDLLVKAAAAYDPEIHEAPIVIGHPRTDDPAYGWIKGLAYNEQTGMEAEPHQVNPDFADMVNGGAFKKISASFYRKREKGSVLLSLHFLFTELRLAYGQTIVYRVCWGFVSSHFMGCRREEIYEDDAILNPVRAGMVALLDEWPWSSYRAMAGDASPPKWLTVKGM